MVLSEFGKPDLHQMYAQTLHCIAAEYLNVKLQLISCVIVFQTVGC